MTDKSTPTKKEKEIFSNDKTFNNQSASTNTINHETTQLLPNLRNSEENYQNKTTQNFTFKIIKRRAPWNKKEDDAIIELVNKYGTSNWTIIANEMALIFKSKHRNGKQCRERWHNHLDPIVNKDNWTEEEENILFNKHSEYGNKWSDIAKFLPGRTDNSIKNHFYSKLRKFIRKILKQINKENLLKNNGIDYYKYNSDKVYKLLKKYKITYKNVTKDTILNLIIATEKNQKGKIFGVSEENKINNDNNLNNDKSNNKVLSNMPFCLDNNLIKNSNEKSSRNNSGNKIIYKTNFNKKSKNKTKLNNNDNNGEALIKKDKDKKIFKSIETPELKQIKNDIIENKNNNNNILNQNSKKRKYQRKNKNDENNENNNNENNNNLDNVKDINKLKKQLTINPDYVNETYKNKNKSKSKIKENKNNDKKLLNKKRRRKKRRKVTISLSTPENKKAQINRIMPKRKFIFGLGHKLPIGNKRSKKNKLEINPEDFDPTINEVEIVRDGLEIHSKSIIVINKCLLIDKSFLPNNNYQYKPNPNLNISIPLTPKNQQFPNSTIFPKIIKNNEDITFYSNFNDKNISIGLPTPMDGFYDPPISPIGQYNLPMFPPQSTKNIYNVDFGAENNFLGKTYNNFTPRGIFNGPLFIQKTPKKEVILKNKILIQSNNINGDENINSNNIQENNSKKPAALNMDLIENYNNETNNQYPGYPFFGSNENNGSSVAKQIISTPANIFNLSPTSPFIPRNFGN